MDRRTFLGAGAMAPYLLQSQTAADQDGFSSLFDGKTLAGWIVREGPDSAFYVEDGAIVVHESAGFPAWLSSVQPYENFDFRGEFFVKGWTDSGIYLHAPEHGRPMWAGMQIHLFHQVDKEPAPQSMGAIFPVVAPKLVNVKNQGEWNTFRILMDWPHLQVWTNNEVVQDLDVSANAELRHRLRSGYLGFESLSYPIRFRNLKLRELKSTDKWQTLYHGPSDFDQWYISEGTPLFQPLNQVIHGTGSGHLATKEQYRDFELQLYIRHSKHHNGGVLFRTEGKGLSRQHYEIQLHDVEGAHYPTGSLYGFKRSIYPKIEPEVWFPLQLIVQGPNCLVRINGETVMEYNRLAVLDQGHIELQAHQPGTWTEYKSIQVKRL